MRFEVPSAGLEPAHPAPEAGALSSELRGRALVSRYAGRHTPDSVVSAIYLRPARGPGVAWPDGCCPSSPAPLRRDSAAPPVGSRPAHPPCCRGRLACVRPSPGHTLAFPASFHPYPRTGRRQVFSLLRLSSRALAGGAPPLPVSRGPPVCGSREVPLARRPAADRPGTPGYVRCGRGDSNSHPRNRGLGPQPSASANSATPADMSLRRAAPRAEGACAEGETRTRTGVLPLRPERSASANSATPALPCRQYPREDSNLRPSGPQPDALIH